MSIHVNEQVHALLTDKGQEVWMAHQLTLREATLDARDDGGRAPPRDIVTTLSELMQVFGPHMAGEWQMFVNSIVTVGVVAPYVR